MKKNIITPKNQEEYQQQVSNLQKLGFQAIIPGVSDIELPEDKSFQSQVAATENAQTPIDGMRRGGLMGNNADMLDYSQIVSIPIANVGTENLGYVPWGNHDDLPNKIFRIAAALPYTAQALQYLTDTATALGPRLMYSLARYSGGTVTHELIPYEDAGIYLRARKTELLTKLSSLEAGAAQPAETATGSMASEVQPQPSVPSDTSLVRNHLSEELSIVESDLIAWEATMVEVENFHNENNLDQHYQRCMAEDVRLDIYFPTVGLSQGNSGKWNPKIVRIGHLDASCTRFEEMDENWHINNVYYGNVFRDEHVVNGTVVVNRDEVVAYPVASPEHNFTEITDYARTNQRTRVGERRLWWCCPQYNPTPTKPYYPQPAWWSIFPSQVYQYASTLIYDKAIARKNSTMWGKILFVNTSFLQQIFMQMGIEGDPDKQKEYRQQIYSRVEDFLRRRDNNGKLLVMDSYMSADEKNLIDSIRIVDVPQASQAESDKSLQIATSAVFFALGVHPALVGAEPGKTSTGGTFQRELHLLKVTQLSPRQRRYLNWLNSIARFNGWDKHATYVIKQANLSTLDASKTGIVERADD